MDRDTYDLIEAQNFSALKHLDDCPAMYWHWQQNHENDKDARRLGRAFHCSVLEPQEFDKRFAVWQGGDKRKKRELWEEFQEIHRDKDILTAQEAEQARKMGQAARVNRVIGPMLRCGKSEHAILWTHHGRVSVDLKGMIDHVNDEVGAILDLKSTVNPSPRAFGAQAFKYKWHVQAAMYVDGYKASTGRELPCYLGAVGKSPPYLVQAYRVSDVDLHLGRELYERWLDTYVACRDAELWPAYSPTELALELPNWAYDENDVEEFNIKEAPSAD